MELKEYLRVLRGRWVLILACTAAVVAVAGLITLQSTPQYSSSSRVFISTVGSKDAASPDTAYQGGLAATQRVQSYAALVSDGTLVNRVVEAMNLDMTPADLSREIKAEVVPETVLLQVQVTDPSAKRAQAICGEVVDQLRTLISEIETPPGQNTPLLNATIVSPASLATSAVTPKPVRNLLFALGIGLLAGVAAAVARELLDSSVKSGRDVEETLHAPLLGGIAMDPQAVTTPLVTSVSSHAPRAEAFRVLRTNLQFVNIDAPNKVIVITSSLPGEGKSSTAVNVAITMAQAGQRVLLVDGDLRRPQVATMLNLESAVGVTTVLLGRVELEDAVQEHEASGLSVLTSGTIPPNPAELLQSFAMTELLEQIRADFDIVIIDSPPLLPVTDAALIASQADGAVLVVRHGRTTKEQLAGARERLVGVDAHVLGAVFNRLKTGASNDAGGYGYGYGYGPEVPVDADGSVVGPPEVRDAGYDTDVARPDDPGRDPRVPALFEPEVLDPDPSGADGQDTGEQDPGDQEPDVGPRAAVLSITKAWRGASPAETRFTPDGQGPRFDHGGHLTDHLHVTAAPDDASQVVGDDRDGSALRFAQPSEPADADRDLDLDEEPNTGSYAFLFADDAPADSDLGVVHVRTSYDDALIDARYPGDDVADDRTAAPGGDGQPGEVGGDRHDLDGADDVDGVAGVDEADDDNLDADLTVPWTSGRRARGRHRG